MLQLLMLLANRPTEMGKTTTAVPVDLNSGLSSGVSDKDQSSYAAAPDDSVEEYDEILCYDDWKGQCDDDERDDFSETDWEENSAAWIALAG